MATLQKSASIPQELRAELARYIGDGRELPPEVRAKYVQVASRLATDQRAAFRQVMEETALRNQRYGVPSEAVVSDPYAKVMGNSLGEPRRSNGATTGGDADDAWAADYLKRKRGGGQ